MKCPKCGFVSYPGLPACKKCGRRFVVSAPKTSISILDLMSSEPAASAPEMSGSLTGPPGDEPSDTVPPEPATIASGVPVPAELPGRIVAEPSPLEDVVGEEELNSQASAMPEVVLQVAAAEQAIQPPEPPPAWRDELAARVEIFRRRRSRLQQGAVEDENLALDFDGASPSSSESVPAGDASLSLHEETDLGDASSTEGAALDSFTLDTARATEAEKDAPLDVTLGECPPAARASQAWDMLITKDGHGERFLADTETATGLEEEPHHRGMDAAPLEAVLGSDESFPGLAFPEPLQAAPLGRRLVAALVDGSILLVAGALFAGTFWMAGGHLSRHPVNFAILGFIAVFLFLSYFGSFTSVTAATPGLSCVGIKVCNLEGAPPTGRESWWRAFGYLVSAAALLLGFVWAAFDSEGLTWHDRMSGTLLIRDAGR